MGDSFWDRHRFPLHVHIATLFITLILVVGLGLSYFSFVQSKKLVLDATDQIFNQVVSETALNFKQMFNPIQQAVKFLVHSPVNRAEDLSSRLDQLPLFLAALEGQPYLTSLYIGYVDGDFFIVRQVLDESQQAHFKAPDHTRYVIDHIETTSGVAEMLRLFLDAEGNELAESDLGITEFDPRTRPWYGRALQNEGITGTHPYLFYFAGKVGITIAMENKSNHAVVAADITLEQLSLSINEHQLTESAITLLYTADSRVLAYKDLDMLIQDANPRDADVALIEELNHPLIEKVNSRLGTQISRFKQELNGENWEIKIAPIQLNQQATVYLALMAPEREIIAGATRIQRSTALITLLIVVLSVPAAWFIADRIAAPLRHLATESQLIEHFDFDSPIKTKSIVSEIARLADSMKVMKNTIHRFLSLVKSISGEKNFDDLLQRVTQETMLASKADAALVYLLDSNDHLKPSCVKTKKNISANSILGDIKEIAEDHPMYTCLHSGHRSNHDLNDKTEPQILSLIEKYSAKHPDLNSLFKQLNCHYLMVAQFPLINRNHENIGILSLFYTVETGHPDTYTVDDKYIRFISALSGFTALSMESRQLIQSQKDLLDAFIKLIAGAIDAKSPYTGGHCQRVPELTRMLTAAACECKTPPFQFFELEKDAWEELHIASWLHDCGKVTTPEYVVDKATKLESLYNRIHEVRMRFEVLKRDAEIEFWQKIVDGGDAGPLRKQLKIRHSNLDKDFAFVASCNLGGESMAPEQLTRLRKIANMTWLRTMDNRLGISWEEERRLPRQPPTLPIKEKLLADKPEHILVRSPKDQFGNNNPWGFKLNVPENKLNKGEVYNLSVPRGTLTQEERYIINDHITRTIIMLEELPYPRHLKNVPGIAGGHHEKIDGTGYPKGLRGEDMPVTARVMAIADIFEALTASDRPYKKPKKLSEAIAIMDSMRKKKHIDNDLFTLFLTSGVYLDYARRFLSEEQIDKVDIYRYT